MEMMSVCTQQQAAAATQYARIIIQPAGIMSRGPKARAGWAGLGAMPGAKVTERCAANALTFRESLVGPARLCGDIQVRSILLMHLGSGNR